MAAESIANPAEKQPSPLWTASFVLLCTTVTLGYANFAILQPTIPLFVDELGGSALVAGLALLAFSVPSISIRPWLGRLADAWNPAAILTAGLVFLALGGLLHVIEALAIVFVGAAIRGVGWGALNTGGYAALAASAPADRRGEAAGYYTTFTASPQIILPAIALWMIDGPGGFVAIFVASALFALAGIPSGISMTRALGIAQAQAASAAAPSPQSGLLDRGVLIATGLSLSSTLTGPAVNAFLPLYARSQGIDDIGFFFVVAGVTSIGIRPILGKKSDSIGRGPSILLGLMSQLLGFVLILAANGLPLMLAGGIFFSLGWAMISSTTTALAMDLANPRSRGSSMATFSMSFQLGAGVGAVLAGALADTTGYAGMYIGAIVITFAGLALLASSWRLMPRPEQAAS